MFFKLILVVFRLQKQWKSDSNYVWIVWDYQRFWLSLDLALHLLKEFSQSRSKGFAWNSTRHSAGTFGDEYSCFKVITTVFQCPNTFKVPSRL